MSYFPTIKLAAANYDAFGRVRMSSPVTLFDSQSTYGDSALYWETSVSGTGAVSNTLNSSTVVLSTGGTASGAKAYRATRAFHRYQPGKSQLVLTTFVLGAAASNLRRRIGYFGDRNGVFLEQTASALSFVLRTYTGGSASDTNAVASTAWNVDKFDGTGPSGKTLDVTKTLIMWFDLEWLGVGRVRCGFIIDGEFYVAHQFLNTQNTTDVYMTSACLPVRAEVENTGVTSGTNTLKMICCSVISEGGFEEAAGPQFTATNGITTVGITTRAPVMSIRAKTTGPNSVTNRGQIKPKSVEIFASANTYFELVLNGTLTGPSWASVDATYSLAEKDVAATAISGGVILDSGFVGASVASRNGDVAQIFRNLALVYTELGSAQDTLTLVATSFTGTSNCAGSMTWLELY